MEELIKRLERVIATGAPDKDGQHLRQVIRSIKSIPGGENDT